MLCTFCVGKNILSSTTATQYFINIDYPVVQKLQNNRLEDIMPVIIPTIQNPGQLLLDNTDNLTIETLFDVQLPNGEEVIHVSLFTSHNIL